MNISINNNYNPSVKANYISNLKNATIEISGGKKIFLRNQNNQFMEAFITKPVKNSLHGKDAIESYFQTEFKPNGLLAEDIADFSGKICDEIGHNSIDLKCGAKLNTGIDDIKLYLKGLLKAING